MSTRFCLASDYRKLSHYLRDCLRVGRQLFVYNQAHLQADRWPMSTAQTPNVWVPVCCERVMRYNLFRQSDGSGYGALVCTVCNKNITLELEQFADLSGYGEGARVLSVLGAAKPPNVERRKAAGDAAENDQTL